MSLSSLRVAGKVLERGWYGRPLKGRKLLVYRSLFLLSRRRMISSLGLVLKIPGMLILI